MELIFALHKPEEFRNTPHGKGHAVSIPPSLTSSAAAPHFTSQVRNRKYMQYVAMKL
jgi:hypothetical protein